MSRREKRPWLWGLWGLWGLPLGWGLAVGSLGACGRSNDQILNAPTTAPAAELTTIATSPSVPATEPGYDYEAPNGSFRIVFPAEPETSLSPWTAAYYDGGNRFYYARGDAPGPAINTDDRNRLSDYLQHVARGVIQQFGAQQIDRFDRQTINPQPTARFFFQNKRGIQYEARAIFDPDRGQLFVLVFGTTEGSAQLGSPESQAFFQSFRPLPPRSSDQADD
ncbi:MAG: hypothetical protein EA001_07170 [Oscillatoriales cyanobacterium]|nr:MAG: hypothetical protein EA001_07170 [Oscillatoriales cyanobacterium]